MNLFAILPEVLLPIQGVAAWYPWDYQTKWMHEIIPSQMKGSQSLITTQVKVMKENKPVTNTKYTETVWHTLEVESTNGITKPVYVNALLGLEADDGYNVRPMN